MKIAKLSSSPYSGINKISRTPSYVFIQPTRSQGLKKSNSNSSVRARNKDSKNSFCQEDLSFLNQNPNNQWESLKKQARLIKEKLTSREKISENQDIHQEYSEFFEEIIEKDTIFSEILKKIKKHYDNLLINMKKEISQITEHTNKQIEEKQSYIKMLERISKENIELGSEVQRMENICTDLQVAIDDIRNINLENVPRNDEDWKALIFENSQYSVLCHNMKLDIRDYQFKEDQLIKLVDALKNRGYPVDQIYEEDVRTKLETDSDSSKSLNTSKFKKIPTLELSKILKSSDSYNYKE